MVQAPGQARIGFLVVPGFSEDRVEMKHERVGVQTQLAMPEVPADAAADISCRRRTVVGTEADPLKIGSKAQALVTRCLGTDIHLDIAQAAFDL
ncbi:hypothetical protein D3C78_522440 [compost metagenome]